MRLLTIEHAKKLTTKRLLAYYRSKQGILHRSQDWEGKIDWNKKMEILREHMSQIKELLDNREHVTKEN